MFFKTTKCMALSLTSWSLMAIPMLRCGCRYYSTPSGVLVPFTALPIKDFFNVLAGAIVRNVLECHRVPSPEASTATLCYAPASALIIGILRVSDSFRLLYQPFLRESSMPIRAP